MSFSDDLASPSEELLDEIIWSEIPADGQAHDTSESHCLICGSHYPRHLSDCRYLALRTTKEGDMPRNPPEKPQEAR